MDINLSHIPLLPGVYLFKSARDKIIYVGKAKCLRRRVASYFRDNTAALPAKTQAMLRQATSLDTLSTTTEKEALLLEAELIKKHRPRYNITLRDDKQYFLFCLDKNHPFPRLAVIRPRPGRDDKQSCAAGDYDIGEATGAAGPAEAAGDSTPKSGRRNARQRNTVLFGPYASGLAARETWRLLHHIFPLRRCSDRMFRNRVRPCLYHQMGQCLGPCTLPVDQAQYARMVEQVELFLNGRSRELLDLLRARMHSAAEALDFEQAARLRDQIRAVEKTVEQQVVVSQTANDLDVLGLAESGEGLGLAVIFVRGGKVMDGRVFFWPSLTLAEGNEALSGFLGQFYNRPSLIPAHILLPWKLAAPEESSPDEPGHTEASAAELYYYKDKTPQPGEIPAPTSAFALGSPPSPDDQTLLWEEVLGDLRGGPVRLLSPRDSRERHLVRMAEANARQGAKVAEQTPLAELLAARLHLTAPPSRIEAVDISHTGGQEARAGLVVFVDGVPRRDEFRAYTFPGGRKHDLASETLHPAPVPEAAPQNADCPAETPEERPPYSFTPGDDYGALAAWVQRRLDSGPPWPDLLLIDGGLGQLAAIERALHDAGQDDLFALAAIAKARTETGRPDRRAGNVADRIFIPGRKNPLPLKEGSPELLFLQRVRDTVHDHALGRHRRARTKAALAGALLDVPGIGPKTAALLWANFDSLPDMAASSEETLAAISGIGKAKARQLKEGLARFARG